MLSLIDTSMACRIETFLTFVPLCTCGGLVYIKYFIGQVPISLEVSSMLSYILLNSYKHI